MSDLYLYYNSIKDTPVCGHLDFNCLMIMKPIMTSYCSSLPLAIQYPLGDLFNSVAVLRLGGLIYHMRGFFSTKARKKYYHMRV